MKTTSKNITGISGVYFVVTELTRNGHIALPTVGNIPGIDILAANSDGSRYVNIQVKTSRNKVRFWLLGAGGVPQNMRDKKSFYVFVRNDDEGRFEAFVVSGDEVHKQNIKHYREVNARGKTAWNEWTLPKDRADEYRNKWDKLGLD